MYCGDLKTQCLLAQNCGRDGERETGKLRVKQEDEIRTHPPLLFFLLLFKGDTVSQSHSRTHARHSAFVSAFALLMRSSL